MAFGNLMGVKLVLSRNYTIEELYDKIKDAPLAAGRPQLVNHGPAVLIAFPELDRNNQVQILGKNGKFNVMRSHQPAGLDKTAVNMALDKLTGGLTGMSGVLGKTKKRCEELAKQTGEQINAMRL